MRTGSCVTPTYTRSILIFCFHLSNSSALVNVVLWGERATSFPDDQVCKDGQTSPQVIIFVGTIVKNYAGRYANYCALT